MEPKTNCKRCAKFENKQRRPGLICGNCNGFVHLTCLRSHTTPGNFAGDVFFNYCCEECDPTNTESITRKQFNFRWLNVIYLTIHHLTTNSMGISNQGYFHYKTHIASFIDRNWQLLFEPHFKQKKNWIGTIAGQLSMNSGTYFRSGTVALRESGWWQLQNKFSPAVAAHISTEMARVKPKKRNRAALTTTDRPGFFDKVMELGYENLLNSSFSIPCPTSSTTPTSPDPTVPAKRSKEDGVGDAPTEETEQEYHLVPIQLDLPLKCEPRSEEEPTEAQSKLPTDATSDVPSDVPSDAFADCVVYERVEYMVDDLEPPMHALNVAQSETSSTISAQNIETHGVEYEFESRSHSPYQQIVEEYTFENLKTPATAEIKKERKRTEKPLPFKRESLFSAQLNSVDMPWIMPKAENESRKDLVEMSEYAEIQLLKQIDGLLPKVQDLEKKTDLRRLRAKLALRRLKRHKRLPVFDFDKTVKVLGGFISNDKEVVTNVERVLDRFQRSYLMDNLSGTVASSNYGTQLVSYVEPTSLVSPYSGVRLRPFIRREENPKSLWLDVTEELLRKANRADPAYCPPARAPLVFSYVRPQHVAAVNALCAQFFWPGIDLSEALEYPEFSCVVTYKKVVVGCGFLVPDAGPSTAYISFLLTRPEWRKAKIATFILYHLLQTCTGQDVTLHVSPTNPAIFLYQKFGFKVEELVQDFYEKYYDVDYKGCRHALFLRLRR